MPIQLRTLALQGTLVAAFSLKAAAYLVDPPTWADESTVEDCSDWAIARTGQTCESIAAKAGISVSDFRDVYNPILSPDCKLFLGDSYCIQRNWGEPVQPSITSVIPSSTPLSSPSTTLLPSTKTTPSPSATTTTGNGIATPTPIQDGMTKDCNKFYLVQSGDSCQGIVTRHGITLDDLYKWNPAVGTTCSSLWGNTHVCVGVVGFTPVPSTTTTRPSSTSTTPGNGISTPTPTQPAMVSNCVRFYFVKSGDSCTAIASANGISTTDFQTWNGLDAGCTNMWANAYACIGLIGSTPSPSSTSRTSTSTTSTRTGNGVATPTPTQPGMVTNCARFYFVKPGDSCAAIVSANGLSLSQFQTWNSLDAGCTLLWANAYVCIGLIGSTPVPSTTTTRPSSTSTGNGIVTPTPTQPGMVGNCNRFYFVKAGDSCAGIAAAQGVLVDNVRRWNGLDAGCTNLWASVYVCVGVK